MGPHRRGTQPLDEGQGSVVLTRGKVQMCWGQASQRHLGLEQEEQLQAEPGLGWPAWDLTGGHLTSDLEWAEGAEPAPPLKGQLPNSWLSPQCLAQANYRAATKPGYKRVGEPPRHLGELYARAWGPQQASPAPPLPAPEAGAGQGPSGTLQFTPSYITSQPFNPTQSIKPTAGGRGREREGKTTLKGPQKGRQGLCLHS